MRKLLNRKEVATILTTNLQEWKLNVNVEEVQCLNNELTEDDISTICSPEFYDDIYSDEMLENVLENHFLESGLGVYSREAFILIHDIYNK